jgi:hypothetical protein
MPQSFDQRFRAREVQFSSEIRDVSFDHVGMMLPIEIVQVLQQFLL